MSGYLTDWMGDYCGEALAVVRPAYTQSSPDPDRWLELPIEEAKRAALDLLQRLDGFFSAEHGVGQDKLEVMRAYKDPAQLSALPSIKRALDPAGIMNPGKVVPMDR